jgi:hypothetical protein
MEAPRQSKRFERPRKLSDPQCKSLIEYLTAGALAADVAYGQKAEQNKFAKLSLP